MRFLCFSVFLGCQFIIECLGTGQTSWRHSSFRRAPLLRPEQLPLRTKSRYIIDAQGYRVKWACVNWYGAYSTRHVVGGLDNRTMQQIVDAIVEMGFNCVRAMYSIEGWLDNPVIANESLTANPELMGKRFQEIFDINVQMMTDAGLMVIVNNHLSKAGWCCHYSQNEGLWYTPNYSAQVWIDSLVFFAARYRANPLVVAFDLRNEVHDYDGTYLTWGDGNEKTDWALAATTAGNAVLQVNPDVLIVVMAMCFGADLRQMKEKPIQLIYPSRVIYQTHNYLEYQFFENFSQSVIPWTQARDILCGLFFGVLFAQFFILIAWWRAGRPTPPLPGFMLTGSIWVMVHFAVAMIIIKVVFDVINRFCHFSAVNDVMPWMYGAAAFFTFSLLITILALAWTQWPQREPASEAGSTSGHGVANTPTMANAPVAKEATPIVGEPERVEYTSPTTAVVAELPRSSRRRVKTERCCVPGWASVVRACSCRNKVATHDIREVAKPVWDCGACCCLQCYILCFIWGVVLLWWFVFAFILPAYWWMERHLDGLWGFALEEGLPYTAPVWMGEFGQQVRGAYWLNFMRYLSDRDVDFAYWAINGRKWTEGEIDVTSGNFKIFENPMWTDETFGLLDYNYTMIRNPWLIGDLQGIVDTPPSWAPSEGALPCSYSWHRACGT